MDLSPPPPKSSGVTIAKNAMMELGRYFVLVQTMVFFVVSLAPSDRRCKLGYLTLGLSFTSGLFFALPLTDYLFRQIKAEWSQLSFVDWIIILASVLPAYAFWFVTMFAVVQMSVFSCGSS